MPTLFRSDNHRKTKLWYFQTRGRQENRETNGSPLDKRDMRRLKKPRLDLWVR